MKTTETIVNETTHGLTQDQLFHNKIGNTE